MVARYIGRVTQKKVVRFHAGKGRRRTPSSPHLPRQLPCLIWQVFRSLSPPTSPGLITFLFRILEATNLGTPFVFEAEPTGTSPRSDKIRKVNCPHLTGWHALKSRLTEREGSMSWVIVGPRSSAHLECRSIGEGCESEYEWSYASSAPADGAQRTHRPLAFPLAARSTIEGWVVVTACTALILPVPGE